MKMRISSYITALSPQSRQTITEKKPVRDNQSLTFNYKEVSITISETEDQRATQGLYDSYGKGRFSEQGAKTKNTEGVIDADFEEMPLHASSRLPGGKQTAYFNIEGAEIPVKGTLLNTYI
ncbi:MAG: hypothetical protein HQM16_10550 [Deltaproteobacteria bacterium]|nr:hypothetical protein [Deltaproteobacteria bacterium]